MLSGIKERYSSSLERANKFLQNKQVVAKGTSISSSRESCLQNNGAECPLCGIKFIGKNNNTEHVHPRALGGLNINENKIQICTACNNNRNLTMQSVLGNPPYYKNYPKSKSDVENFILWSEITIDDGLEAGRVFHEIHSIFMEFRFSNQQPKGPQRAYGRFSTWDKDSSPNHIKSSDIIHRKTAQSRSLPNKKRRGFFLACFDYIFGYQPREQKIGLATKTSELDQNEEKSDQMKMGDYTDFQKDLVSLVGSNEISLQDLGYAIEKLMVDRGNEIYNPTEFLKSHGLPRGLKKAIDTHCSEILEVYKKGKGWQVRLR